MPDTYDLHESARKEMHVFFVLDTSGSMEGERIAALNRAVRETLPVLKQKAKSNADALLKLAVLEFNSGCRWLNPSGPEPMEYFIWEDLKAGGLTSMGAALKELDSKLSRNQFLSSMTGAYLPVLIFMTDGYATDNYKDALLQIRQNKWFSRGVKIGFAIGDDPDAAMIADIVGDGEAVARTDDLELFARLLETSVVTASLLCSTSRTTSERVTGATILQDVRRQIDADFDTAEVPGAFPEPDDPEPDNIPNAWPDTWVDDDFSFLDVD